MHSKHQRWHFAEIRYGHKFEIRGVGRMPEGFYNHCDFCGGRLKNVVYITRDDFSIFHVGKGCVEMLGFEITGKEKKLKLDEGGVIIG